MRRGAARALASVAKQRPAALAEQPGLAEALCDSTEAKKFNEIQWFSMVFSDFSMISK